MKAKPGGSRLAKFASVAAERYGAELHRFLARRLHRPQEIEDLVQEVYIRLLKIDGGEFVLNPRAYIFRTAANVAHDHAEKDRRAQQHVVVSSEVVNQVTEHPAEHPTCSMSRRLSTQEQLNKALLQLTPIHGSILLMFYRDGYSYEEIALHLQVSVRQVERYLANAKKELMSVDWKWE